MISRMSQQQASRAEAQGGWGIFNCPACLPIGWLHPWQPIQAQVSFELSKSKSTHSSKTPNASFLKTSRTIISISIIKWNILILQVTNVAELVFFQLCQVRQQVSFLSHSNLAIVLVTSRLDYCDNHFSSAPPAHVLWWDPRTELKNGGKRYTALFYFIFNLSFLKYETIWLGLHVCRK